MEKDTTMDLKVLFAKIRGSRNLYFKVLLVVVILASIWIFPQPRFYKSSVSLAPETNDASAAGAMSSLASSFGFNLGGMASSDAFYPLLYPDIVESPDFVVGLFGVNVKTMDSKINTDYFNYLQNHQKVCIWDWPLIYARRTAKKLFKKSPSSSIPGDSAGPNPFCLSEQEDAIYQTICGTVQCSVDKKTEVVTLTVIAQDRLVCATMADSVRVHLQQYITNYRTSKSRADVSYYEKLVQESLQDYEKASAEYAAYADSHKNSILARVSEEESKLENDVAAKYSTYSAFQTQLQAARAKVQESTPAFTVLKRATVPIKPAGPKRMLFILGMAVLSFLGTSIYVLREDIFGK